MAHFNVSLINYASTVATRHVSWAYSITKMPLQPNPATGGYSAPHTPLTDLGATSLKREKRKSKKEEEKVKAKKGMGREGEGWGKAERYGINREGNPLLLGPPHKILDLPLHVMHGDCCFQICCMFI